MAPGVRSPSFAGIIVRSCKRLTWFRWNGSRAGTAWLCCCFSLPPTSPPAFGGGGLHCSPKEPWQESRGGVLRGALEKLLPSRGSTRRGPECPERGGTAPCTSLEGPLAFGLFDLLTTPQRSRIRCRRTLALCL